MPEPLDTGVMLGRIEAKQDMALSRQDSLEARVITLMERSNAIAERTSVNAAAIKELEKDHAEAVGRTAEIDRRLTKLEAIAIKALAIGGLLATLVSTLGTYVLDKLLK